MASARELVQMLDELGGISDETGRLTRTFLSPAMERATMVAGSYLQDSGMEVHVDKCGNVIGHLACDRPGARTLIMGSHLDTVRDAGKYDGPLGVALPACALMELGRRGVKLPFNVEVVGFSEEEGVRFGTAYLGSKGYLGRLDAATLARADENGTTVREALEQFGGAPFQPSKPRHARRDLIGYFEVHIEQGPVLEEAGLAVGVVSAIAGQSRFKLTWTGQAGHAGTTPMRLRRDALAGAAEFAVAAEVLARRASGLVATIGQLAVAPGAGNVIPGQCGHSLDVRHARDSSRRQALRRLQALAQKIAKRRGLKLRWERTQDNGAVACSAPLRKLLERSVASVQGRSLSLVSGAGHDAVVMSEVAPVAMLFVRCREGLSHHPAEYASPQDLGVALDVTIDFLERLAAEEEKR